MLPTFADTAIKVYTYLTPAYNGTARDPDISSFQTDFRSIQVLTTAVFHNVRSISQATFILHSGVTQLQFSAFILFFSCLSRFRYFFRQFYALTSHHLPPFCLSNGFFRSDLSIKALYFSYHSHMPWVPAIPLSLIWLCK